MRWLSGCPVLLLLIAAPAAAQPARDEPLDCDHMTSDRAHHCEVREEAVALGAPFDVDASPNGGIRVRGWDRADAVLRTRVVAYADTDEEARALASQVRIDAGGGRIRASGPGGRERHWTVSYELHVPQRADLTLRTVNGGISVRGLHGMVRFRATNGGVRLENVGGDVRGETSNGGLHISLDGDRWEGSGLDVETQNGGISLHVPAHYSAELETGTTNGRLRVDFPVTVHGLVDRRLNTTLGAGGPRIRAVTRNGGVSIRRR